MFQQKFTIKPCVLVVGTSGVLPLLLGSTFGASVLLGSSWLCHAQCLFILEQRLPRLDGIASQFLLRVSLIYGGRLAVEKLHATYLVRFVCFLVRSFVCSFPKSNLFTASEIWDSESGTSNIVERPYFFNSTSTSSTERKHRCNEVTPNMLSGGRVVATMVYSERYSVFEHADWP